MPSTPLLITVALGSLLAGALGVTVVVKVQEPIEARVESQQPDGTWKTVAEPQVGGGRIYESNRHPRLVVENHRLIGQTVHVDITYYNAGTYDVLHTTWDLKPLERRNLIFTVPDAAFAPNGPERWNGSTSGLNEGVLVYVNVDDLPMSISLGRR
jgi:hypothetical protein